MKKFILLFLTTFISLITWGQQEIVEKKYGLRTSGTTFGFSTLHLKDNYISPLDYSGTGLKVANENSRLYSPDFMDLSIINRSKLNLGITSNPANTASIMYLGLNFAWGMHYHFRPVTNMQILTGNLADINLGLKYNTRNVNNPFNMDLAINLNLSAILIYDIPAQKRTLRLQAGFETPWIGCMFAPEQGASYYEIFSLKADGKFVHFSSFHNKLALRQTYFIEIPFKNSTWRFGINGDTSKYKANDMIFKMNDFNVFFGYTRIFTRFTRKNPAPANFAGY